MMISEWKRDDIADKYECSSCKEIHNLDRNAPSDEYSIKTSRGKILKTVSNTIYTVFRKKRTRIFSIFVNNRAPI